MNTRNSPRDFYARPLCVSSFLGLFMGIFMLMTLAAPSAHAVNLLVYYNFNNIPDNTPPPYSSVAPGVTGIQLTNTASSGHSIFPGGNLEVDSNVGTTVNQASGDLSGAGGSLDARGNDSTTGGAYCFTIGPFSTAGQLSVNLSFALMSTGSGGFDQINLLYSTNGTLFTNFGTITSVRNITTFTMEAFTLPAGASNQPTLFIEFCFSGTKNNDTHNNTYIDNIQITGVPEPGTVIGGALGVLGLCLSQRRWLVRSLRLRRT